MSRGHRTRTRYPQAGTMSAITKPRILLACCPASSAIDITLLKMIRLAKRTEITMTFRTSAAFSKPSTSIPITTMGCVEAAVVGNMSI